MLFNQSSMNGDGKMTNVVHFDTVVGAFCNEVRTVSRCKVLPTKIRGSACSIVQEFQCLRFPPVGAGVLGDNKVIAPLHSRSVNSSEFATTSALTGEMQLVEHFQAALYFRYVTMTKRMCKGGCLSSDPLGASRLRPAGGVEAIGTKEKFTGPVLPIAMLAP